MMGGRVSVHLRDVPVGAAAGNPAERVLDRIAAWASRLTRFEPASELMRLNAAGAASVRVGPTLTAVLDWARELEGRTDGRIDVAMLDARLAAEAGDPDRPSARRRAALVASAVASWCGRRAPARRCGSTSTASRRGGSPTEPWPSRPGRSAMVDADGDIAARVAPGDAWTVGVADPRDAGRDLLAVVRLAAHRDCAARSGSRRRGPASIAGIGRPARPTT